MKIKEIKTTFAEEKMGKPDFIEAMFEKHKMLFEYSQILSSTDISHISIHDEGITFQARESGLQYFCKRPDKRVAPIEVLNFNKYESRESEIIYSLISDGMSVFDIGANIGWYSTTIAHKYPNSKVYSFEPLKPIFTGLQKNIELNNLENIKAFNFGFSDKAEVLNFHFDPEFSSRSSAQNLAEESHEIESCEVMKMDDFINSQGIDQLDFLKCDVEGAELLVFKGGARSLLAYKPIVLSEILRKWSQKFNYHPNDILSFFSELGYKAFAIGEKIRPINEVDDETRETNYLFLHCDKHAQVIEGIF